MSEPTRVKTFIIGERVYFRNYYGLMGGIFEALDSDAMAWVRADGMEYAMKMDPMNLSTLPHYRMTKCGEVWEWEKI